MISMPQKFGKIRLSQAELKELLDYDQLTGLLTWRISPKHRASVLPPGSRAGSAGKSGYRVITVRGVEYREHRLIWFWMTGENPQLEIDHKDGDPSNNAWENLRTATSLQNAGNACYSRRNKTGFRGVSFSRTSTRGKYHATVWHNREAHFLGYFDSPEEANEAYRRKAKELRGEFYREAPVSLEESLR